MKEFIIHFKITEDCESLEAKIDGNSMQEALQIFKNTYTTAIVLNVEGPYDIR